MSKLLKKIPCKACGSSKTPACQLYEQDDGSITGYCFSCGTYFPDPLEQNKVLYEEEKITMKDLPSVDLKDRKIRKGICELYGVKAEFSEDTGEVEKIYFPLYQNGEEEPSGWKVREAGKKFYSKGKAKDVNPFGFNVFDHHKRKKRAIVITEGEIDALSAYQMILDKTGKKVPCISLPHGANDLNSIKKVYDVLSKYESIYLCTDQDAPGKKAAEELARLFDPGQCKIIRFEEKDANDMLTKGKEDAFIEAFKEATAFRPDGIITIDSILDEVLQDPKEGLSWPWPSLTEATYGYRRNELHGLGAGSGVGKSSALKELAHHIISNHKLPVGMIMLEEPPQRTLKELVGKFMNKMIHLPNTEYDKKEAKKILETIKDKVYLYNHFGAKDFDTIASVIKFYARSLGIKDIFLDHLTALVAQEEDEYRALNRIMEDLAGLTQQLDCTIFYVSHLRKSATTPHEEGGKVSANQFKGSGAIAFWSNFMYGLERDSQAEDPEERNLVTLRVLKDRNTGLATGKTITLHYNHNTGRLLEQAEETF